MSQVGPGGNEPHPGSTLGPAADQAKGRSPDLAFRTFGAIPSSIPAPPRPGRNALGKGSPAKDRADPSGIPGSGQPLSGRCTAETTASPRRLSGPSQHRPGSSAARTPARPAPGARTPPGYPHRRPLPPGPGRPFPAGPTAILLPECPLLTSPGWRRPRGSGRAAEAAGRGVAGPGPGPGPDPGPGPGPGPAARVPPRCGRAEQPGGAGGCGLPPAWDAAGLGKPKTATECLHGEGGSRRRLESGAWGGGGGVFEGLQLS